MKLFVLVNAGFEKSAAAEIKELTGANSVSHDNVLEFETKDDETALSFLNHVQSARRVLVSLGKNNDLDDLDFSGFNFNDFLSSEMSFKIEVENVQGNENRLAIAKKVAGKIYASMDFEPKLEMKNPDCLVVIYFNGKEYFLGVDLCGQELNSRNYRVFTNPASFKGDLAYFFVRKVGFNLDQKILVGFCKDGTMAIESAILVNNIPLLNKKCSANKFPVFSKMDNIVEKNKNNKNNKNNVFAFDPSRQNVTAAKKNSQLAGVKDLVEIQKYSLDELDVKFSENDFDCLIFQVTTKDEDNINEIYYQSNYILKKKGKLLLVGKKNWAVSISDKFKLVDEGEIKKGDSVHKFWLLEKK
jgi:23S rRNA G2445 N2-methylase RlmL